MWIYYLHCFENWLWQVLCALRKNEKIKRMCWFEGRITRHDGYYYWWSYRTTGWMHEQICPPWVRTKRQQVYISMLGMHHYTWHYISSHCTILSLTKSIVCSWYCESFYGSCDWWIKSLILRTYNLFKYCCRPMCYVKLWAVWLSWYYAGCSFGGSDGV